MSCDGGPLAPGQDPWRNVYPLNSNVVFELHEAHGAEGSQIPGYNAVSDPRIAIGLRTEKEYGCYNYHLDTRTSISGHRVQIELLSISIGDICATAIGPARSEFFLDLDQGVYKLSFLKVGSLRRTFELKVSDSSIETSPTDSGFAWPQYGTYWRFPPRSFAVICGTTVETSWMCDALVDSLRSEILLEEFTFPDSGEVPWPRASGGHYYDAPTRFFQYSDESDFQRAGEVLRVFKEEVIADQQGISMWLWNWRNEKYLSWLLGAGRQQENPL